MIIKLFFFFTVRYLVDKHRYVLFSGSIQTYLHVQNVHIFFIYYKIIMIVNCKEKI